MPEPPPIPASVVAIPSAINAVPICPSKFLPVIAETAFTCPTFSAMRTSTTGKNKTIAFPLNVGDVNVGNANHFAALIPSVFTSPIAKAER